MGCTGSKQAQAASVPQPVEGDFKITLERTTDEQALGLSLVKVDGEPGVLSVDALKEEGLVVDYIKAHANTPEQHVAAGDRIVVVNGVSGDADKMLAELKQKNITMAVQRPRVQSVATEEPAVAAPAAVDQAAAEPAVAPAVEATEPAATEPVAEPATTEPVAEPAAEPAAKPAAEPLASEKAAEAPAPVEGEENTAAAEPLASENAAEAPAPVEGEEKIAAAEPSSPEAVSGEAEVVDGVVMDDEKDAKLCKMSLCM